MPLRFVTATPPPGSGTGPGGGGTGVIDPSLSSGVNADGNISATWTAPDGTVYQLTDPNIGWFTRTEITGWGAITYEVTADANAREGETIRHIRANPGRFTWPLYIWGDNHMQFVQRERQIKRAFMMTMHRAKPGTLRVARPDGTAREIDCYCEAGFEGQPDEMYKFATAALTLYAPDGYWRDATPTIEQRSYAPPASFYSPFLTVSGSNVLGDTVMFNPGDVDAWPTWTITGPSTQFSATNRTTGETFTLTYNLLAGETITITTNRPTVRGPAGQNISTALNWPGATLWGLLPGNNTVSFVATGSGDGSAVELRFNARYEGA